MSNLDHDEAQQAASGGDEPEANSTGTPDTSASKPQAQQSSAATERTRLWPDLSSYGLYFGVILMPNGSQRLIMVDVKAQWAVLARRMGFDQSRWLGVWARQDLNFTIPDFKKLFPKATVSQMTDAQIRDQIRVKIEERRSMRLSQMSEEVKRSQRGGALSWHPSKTAAAPAPAKAAPAPRPGLRPVVAAARNQDPAPARPVLAPPPQPVVSSRPGMKRQVAPKPPTSAAVAGTRRLSDPRENVRELLRVAIEDQANAQLGQASVGDAPAPVIASHGGLVDAEGFVNRVAGLSSEGVEIDAVDAEEGINEAPREIVLDAPVRHDEEGANEQVAVSAEAAMRQTFLLGSNYMGQAVYESGDGRRFLKSADAEVIAVEQDATKGPLFLRASSDDDLHLCAAGMVHDMERGKNLHSEDFIRYMAAAMGADAQQDKTAVSRFQYAIDQAMLDAAARKQGADEQAFNFALQLHECRPSFWRATGTLPTPLPISVALQSLVAEAVAPGGAKIIDVAATSRAHSWSLEGAERVGQDSIPTHDVAVGGIFGDSLSLSESSAALEKHGVRVSRADHRVILDSLSVRTDAGMSAFIIAGDKRPGHVAPDMRRVLSFIGARYELKGLVDIAPAMVAPGNDISSRVIVIGDKKAEIDETYSVPSSIAVLHDYGSLWAWVDTTKAANDNEMTFGDDGRQENRWQAPYIPASQITEPKAMSPRNLLGPVRKALARIVESEGMGVDEYVADKLGWTLEEMEEKQFLDAEQIDAVALMIYADKNDYGFVEADATGIGKGRTLAAYMRYRRLQGKPVMFISENVDLFRDIYRDIRDIDSMDLFANPLIINRNVKITDSDGAVIGQSLPAADMRRIYLSERLPAEHPFILSTYTQLNRECTITPGFAGRLGAAIEGLEAGTMGRHEAMSALRTDFGFNLMEGANAGSNEEAIERLKNFIQQALDSSLSLGTVDGEPAEKSEDLLDAERQLRLREMPDDEFMAEVEGLVPTQLGQLKLSWLRSAAMREVTVVVDESHNASGPSSTTNANMEPLVGDAEAVMFSSATFAKEFHNFALYKRIFPEGMHTSNIADALARGGEPVQEILTAALAEDGRMIRREHDNSNVEYRVLADVERLERNEQWSDSLARVMVALSSLSGEVAQKSNVLNKAHQDAIDAAKKAAIQAAENARMLGLSVRKPRITEIGVKYSTFSSRFYNITRAFMLAIKADLAADAAITSRKEGRKPFIILESTMEGVLNELLREDFADDEGVLSDDDGALMAGNDSLANGASASEGKKAEGVGRSRVFPTGRRLGFKELLSRYADNVFYAWEVKRRGKTIISKKRLDLRYPGAEVALDLVRKLIAEMPDVPLSPIDHFRERVEAAGLSYAEISGRKTRVETMPDGTHGIVRYNKPERWESVRDFNGGTVDVLLASRSGSTGISVHASSKFADQSQREAIEWQPISNVTGRQQSLGRHNRKDQVTPPMVTGLSSGLPGEMRLQMMQNNALRKVSAITSGNADNPAIDENIPDLINSVGNEICYRWLEGNPTYAELLGVDVDDFGEKDAQSLMGTKWVDSLTGRIMMLPVNDQRRVYKELDAEFHALIEQYEMEGRNPLKSSQHDVRASRTRSRVFEVSPFSGNTTFSQPVVVSEITYPVVAKALDTDQMIEEAIKSLQTLRGRFGNNYQAEISKLVTKVAENDMEVLCKKWSSIEEALSQEAPNAVINYHARQRMIQTMVSSVRPGSIVHIKDNGFHDVLFVAGIEPPEQENRFVAPSDYKVRVYSANRRKRFHMSLSALHNSWLNSDEMTCSVDDPKYADFFKQWESRFTKEAKWDVSRVILEGNLFRASMISNSERTGQAVTFTDDKGIWRHAIMLPGSVEYDHVDRMMPVNIDTAAVMKDAIQLMASPEDENGQIFEITDSFDHAKKTYSIYFKKSEGGHLHISLFKGAEASGWIWKDEEIRKTFLTEVEGMRVKRAVDVDPQKIGEFAAAFVSAASRLGKEIRVTGRARSQLNELNEKRQAAAQAALAGPALCSGPETAVDVEQQLAAMGF